MNHHLGDEILRTIKYFDLFDQPLTLVQVWQLRILEKEQKTGSEKLGNLSEIRSSLNQLVEGKKLGQRWGFYYLEGRDELVGERILRHRLAQQKWKLTRRLMKVLRWAPGVKMMAMSGSLSLANTKPESDLDIFVVTMPKRIWLTRLLLLVTAQLTGKRRHYNENPAPNKLCLNHYLTSEALVINPEIRNLYTAVLYWSLIPVEGWQTFLEFKQKNRRWMKRWLLLTENELASRLTFKTGLFWRKWQKGWEFILRSEVGSWLEKWAERLQRKKIEEHGAESQKGRVVLSATELAFHPDTKVPVILRRFSEEAGQGKLL